jgi:hypothetical protein
MRQQTPANIGQEVMRDKAIETTFAAVHRLLRKRALIADKPTQLIRW